MVKDQRSAEAGVAAVYSEEFLRHDPGPYHPERPERLEAIVGALRKSGIWQKLTLLQPRMAREEEVLLVHERSYLELLKQLCEREVPLDSDTPTRPETYELSLLATGGTLVGAKEVLDGRSCFCLVRPPGHHASRDRGAGFCYLNNAAIAAAWVRERGVRRILILDLDAHCGDGTEEIFYSDPEVLYISFHQDPSTFYPGTGFVWQVGEGEGEGYTVNVPMSPGSGDAEYAAALQEIFEPLYPQFKPEMLIVSMGFDAHEDDPLTSLKLSSTSFGWLARAVVRKKPALFVLEGGYNLTGTAEGACNVFRAMLGEEFEMPQPKRPAVIEEVKRTLGKYWRLGV
jgi:acetoin utilization deacetylase AcuC-like enzyme